MHRYTLPLLVLLLLPSLALAQSPVDTHQFGLLAVGMTPANVVQRLGPPAAVVPLAPLVVTRGHSRRSVLRRGERRHEAVSVAVPREAWHYPGDRGTPPTALLFEAGRLARWGRRR